LCLYEHLILNVREKPFQVACVEEQDNYTVWRIFLIAIIVPLLWIIAYDLSAKNVSFGADKVKDSAAPRGDYSFFRGGIKEYKVDKICSGGSALLTKASTLAARASWRASNLLLRAITFISGQRDRIIIMKSLL
jgi:hypothetical protein